MAVILHNDIEATLTGELGELAQTIGGALLLFGIGPFIVGLGIDPNGMATQGLRRLGPPIVILHRLLPLLRVRIPQRALAIDDAYMPAFNQLALYYFQQAKKRAGAIKSSQKGSRGRQIATNAAMAKRADVQQLELAALVCSQAIRKNPSYAPIHNTAGLIQNELGQVNSAVAEFASAAKLDPKFFEAQMNYAAVNLSFRGFEQAAGAYKKALEMRPNDYDAHLGLALALRGLINDSNYDAQVAAVQAELDTCKKLDGNRPDAYFNEGILTQEYKAKAGGGKDKTIAALTQAKTIYQQFIDKAAGKPEYDGAVKSARGNGTDKDRGRMGDIDDTIQFLNLEVKTDAPKEAPKDAPKDAPKP